jgi:RNA recognition motif-containing protein
MRRRRKLVFFHRTFLDSCQAAYLAPKTERRQVLAFSGTKSKDALTRDSTFLQNINKSLGRPIQSITYPQTPKEKDWTMAETTRQKATLFVGGLDNQVTEQTLHDAFIPFGEVVDVSIPKPESYVHKQSANFTLPKFPTNTLGRKSSTQETQAQSGPHRGFGYVEFALPEDAREAIDNMDQAELFGRVIKVNQAKPQKDGTEGLGSRRALWEQVCLFFLPFSPSRISQNLNDC